MRMTNIQENNNNYDNNNNNNNNPKPTSRIPSLQHSREPPQKMNYSLFDFVIFFLPLFSDFKYSTRVICIYAVSFIGIYMVSLCRKTHGKITFFSFYSTESLIFYNHYWVKTTRIRSVLAVQCLLHGSNAVLLFCQTSYFFFDQRTLLNAEQACVRLNVLWITSSLRAVFIFSVKSVRRAIPSTRQP